MKIQEIEFSRLIPADYNPRVALTPDMPEFERLKNSIETFGNVEPIVWNERTGHIVGGHQCLAVLQHLGYSLRHLHGYAALHKVGLAVHAHEHRLAVAVAVLEQPDHHGVLFLCAFLRRCCGLCFFGLCCLCSFLLLYCHL